MFEVTWEGPVAVVEFSHGKANEMGTAQLEALEALCEELVERSARALVTWSRKVSRRGTPIFVAGADVLERRGWSEARVEEHVGYQREVLGRVRALPLFHVTLVHGVALGWGTEFLITADYRLATPTASFALPETGLGIVPGAGGTTELWTLIGVPQAMRMGMTGERLDAAEALRIGLVQEVTPDVDAGLERARELSRGVARRSPTSIAAFKAALLGSVGQPRPRRQELEARAYAHCLQQGDAAVGRQHFKAILAGEQAPWGERRLMD
ncbi:MAG: hypothetical protein CMH57_13290 [Myxococcales bacterium]|nr:hypothetical protein [Myxococcales bacterium]